MEWKEIEQKAKFRNSLLWKLQETAYKQFGPSAWTQKGVPFYLTSNPLIAKQFALLISNWIKDCSSQGLLDLSQPLYLFDLGAGSGRLAYQILKTLLPLLDPSFSITYVMTDMVEENLSFWKEHPLLKPYLESGVLDYALYHHESQEALVLRHQEKSLDTFVNPICLIGTYFFDTIPQDLFRVRRSEKGESELEEGRISLKVPFEDFERSNASLDPKWIMQLEANYDYILIENPQTYYDESYLNTLLMETARHVEESSFLFPAPGLQVVEAFAKRANGRMLLLAADQGLATLEQIRACSEPKISRHASFSIPVNYWAMARYFEDKKGKGFLTAVPKFVVMVGLMGGSGLFQRTERVFLEHLKAFEPVEYWELTGFSDEVAKELSLKQLMVLIKLGNYDPLVLYAFFEIVREKLKKKREEVVQCKTELKMWEEVIWRCGEHFYPVSLMELGFLMNLGVLLFEIGCYEKALFFFEKGEFLVGEEAFKGKEGENEEAVALKKNFFQNKMSCYAKKKAIL